jgi:mono/diheme cytochrome c family protein
VSARRLLGAIAMLASCVAPSLQAADAADSTLERGRAAFTHRCAMCHRDGGTGTFILARRLGKERSLLERRTDLQGDYIRYVVRWGLVNMPRISRVELPDPDHEAVAAYLTSPDAKP